MQPATKITSQDISNMQGFCAHQNRGIVPKLVKGEIKLNKEQADKYYWDFYNRYADYTSRYDATERYAGTPKAERDIKLKEWSRSYELFNDLIKKNTVK